MRTVTRCRVFVRRVALAAGVTAGLVAGGLAPGVVSADSGSAAQVRAAVAGPEVEEWPPLPGDVDAWVETMEAHGIEWDEEEERRPSHPVVGPVLSWTGQTAFEPGDPLYGANAVADADRELLLTGCAVLGAAESGELPERTDSFFGDCVTAAEVEGVDAERAEEWIARELAVMARSGETRCEDLDMGPATLRLVVAVVAVPTATVEVLPVEVGEATREEGEASALC
ncbi:hypothetical protein GL263_05295 [Streptomyces durbertensis]|uniref:Secreted protein n=1 Tax=Streptomyces durbertensis TaxID=2448886 RepID=A0ABR6ECC7_9ACTN|nr:hypothetical protein [Streptomyces durbertensis]MBB1242981.1 hypothetical protein [Streptomyces durbertensis]